MEQVLDEITTTTKKANPDLARMDPRGLPAQEIAKRAAAEKLEVLKAEFAEMVANRVGAIFVSGSPEAVKKFVADAVEKGPAIAVEADSFYRKLALEVEPTMRQDRNFEPQQFWNFGTALERVCHDLGVRTPSISYQPATLRDRVALEKHLRKIIRQGAGDTTLATILLKQISGKAIEIGYAASALPVVVTGATEDELNSLGSGLFGGRFVNVNLRSVVDETELAATFQDLKKTFKKQ